MRKQILYNLLIIALFQLILVRSDVCSSNSLSTNYDGYLEPFINYGSFKQSQNSYFSFSNPFQGISPLNLATVQFWAKIPIASTDATAQFGTFLDCSETMSIRLVNDSVILYVSSSKNSTNGSLTTKVFNTSSIQQQWNHYAFSYTSKTLLIYFNGVQIGKSSIPLSFLNSSTSQCSIGNSLKLNDPINAYFRHFQFSKTAISTSSNLGNLMHHIPQPSDSNLLAYFDFSSTFNFEETYFHNASAQFQQNNVAIVQSSEPEFVCYCTGTYANFLNVTSNYVINPINLTNSSTTKIDANGFVIDFQILASQNNKENVDQILFTLNNYANVVLTNQSTLIRIDLYNKSSIIQNSFNLSGYTFRFNYWTQYTINVTKTAITLFIDGAQMSTVKHSIVLPTNSTLLYIQPSQSITYLLNTLQLRNYNGVNIYKNTYTENIFIPTFQSTFIFSGAIEFGANSKLCTQSQANLTTYWSGSSCVDKNLIPFFNGNNQSSSTQIIGSMVSAQGSQTIELWFRDNNTISQATQVIFDNTVDNQTSFIQISILTGNSLTQGRILSCNPNAGTEFTNMALNVTTYNTWIHYSCIFDASNQQTKALSFNAKTQSSLDRVLSYQGAFPDSDGPILTSLGSNFMGINKFTGYLRDFRFWNVARSYYEIQLNRYQTIASNASLVYYFKFSDQMNPYFIQDQQSVSNYFVETSQTSNTISYLTEKNVIICQPGLYYAGTCCVPFSISDIDFQFKYSSTSNNFQIYVDYNTLVNPSLWQSINANFQVISVGNNFNTTYLGKTMTYQQYLTTIFNYNGMQNASIYNNNQYAAGFNVSSNLIDPKAYNITIQATIYSDYQPQVQVVKTKTLTLTCPFVWLNILPNYVTDSTQIVSLTANDSQPIIYAQVASQCYIPSQKSVITYNFTSATWGYNVTSKTFKTLFSTASDSMSVYSTKTNYLLNGSNQYVTVSTNMTLNYQIGTAKTTNVVTNSIKLYYAPIKIISSLQQTSLTFSKIQGDILTVDLSSASSSNSSYSVYYQLQCPQGIFINQSQYNSLCQFSSNGIFTLDTNQVQVITNQIYYFYFQAIINGTSILQNIQAAVTFYKDGGNLVTCPAVMLQSSYSYNFKNPQILSLFPDIFQYCSGTAYTVTKLNWTATDSISGSAVNNFFTYGNQSIYNTANITTTAASKIQSGSKLNIVVSVTFQDQSGTSQVITNSSYIQFSENPIVVQLVATNKNRSTLVNNTVNFLESEMVINATTSYDPDNTTQLLTYQWTCPDEVTTYYTCMSLVKGSQNQAIQLNALQRAKIGFNFGQLYSFTVTASSPTNLYKTPQSQTIQMTFNPPTKLDVKNSNDMTPTCDTMSIPTTTSQVQNVSATFQKVVKFDINNYTNSQFNINFNNTSGTCKNGIVLEQIMFFYSYDTNFFLNGTPASIIYEQNSSNTISASNTINMKLSPQFQLSNLNVTSYYQSTVYWFTQRSNNTDQIYLNMDTVYLYRTKANLIAQLVNSNITVDKYGTLILDASNSYDQDNLGLNYYYKWTCPGNISVCASQNTSQLIVLSKDRSLGQSNSINQAYSYSVQMLEGSRISSAVSALITVQTLYNYSACLITWLNSDILNNYQPDMNNTIFIEYNQPFSIPVQMILNQSCQGINIETTTFSTDKNQVFWTVDAQTVAKINLQNSLFMKQLTVGTPVTINYLQQFSLGADTYSKFFTSGWVNVQLQAPDLVVSIVGPQIAYFYDTENQVITLDGSGSSDPMGLSFTYQWKCPSYFGDVNCQQSTTQLNQLQLSYSGLNQYTSPNTPDYYYETSHEFVLTIISSDGVRQSSKSFYLYLADPTTSQLAQPSIVQCGIQLLNDQNSQLPFNTSSTFYISCTGNQTLTNLLSTSPLLWQIGSLQRNIDYYQVGSQLIVKPFRSQIIQDTQMLVRLYIGNYNDHEPIVRAFQIMLNELQLGTISQDLNDSGYQYSETYNLSIQRFYSNNYYGIHSQLRGYFDNQDTYEYIFPLKPHTNFYLNNYYQAIQIPYISQLLLDFFDMNLKYIGTVDIIDQIFGGDVVKGFYEQTAYENVLNSIVNNNLTSYPNAASGKIKFETDLQTVKSLSEAILLNIINIEDTTIYQQYQQAILSYLTTNYVKALAYFNTSTTAYDTSSKYLLERKAVYILNNILTKDNSIQNQLSQTISILETIMIDYSLFTLEGEETEVMRQTLINIIDVINYQLTQIGVNTYATRIKNIQTKLIGNDVKSLSKGQVTSYVSGTTNRQVMLLQTDATKTQQVNFTSQLNTNEIVQIKNQAQLVQNGVSSMEVSYSMQSNNSAPGTTVLYMNAYDSNYNRLSLQFQQYITISNTTNPDDGTSDAVQQLQSYITMQMEVQYNNLYKFRTPTDGSTTQLYPKCVYYDEINKGWSSEGVLTLSYDQSTGFINCSTFHLSQFSIDYYYGQAQVVDGGDTDGDGGEDDGGANNQTIYGNSTNKFFEDQGGYYIAIIIIVSILCFASIGFSFISFTKWDYGDPNIGEMQRNHSFCSIYGTSLFLNQLILSAWVGPSYGSLFLTIPKYNKMVMNWIIFFIIALIIGIVISKAEGSFSDWETGQLVGLGAIVLVCVHIFRIIVQSMMYFFYFLNQSKNKQPNFHDIRNDKQKVQYEGGERDQSNKNTNKKKGPDFSHGKKSTSSNIDIDEIDMEVQNQSNRNAFFNSNNHGINKPQTSEKTVVTKKNHNNQGSHQNSEEEGGKINAVNRFSNLKPAENNKENSARVDIHIDTGRNMGVSEIKKSDGPNHGDEGRLNSEIDSDRQLNNETNVAMNKNDKETIPKSSKQKEISPANAAKPKQSKDTSSYGKAPVAACGLLFMLVILLIEMAIAFYFMWTLVDEDHVKHWAGSILGIYFFLLIIVDPILILLFSLIFHWTGPYSSGTKFAGVLFIGNGHSNLVHGILYHLNQK